MSKTPNFDAKIQNILDALKPEEKICELRGEKWMMDEEEIGWYKKLRIPPSPYSPLTRMLIFASNGGAYQWWYQKHPETGKMLLTSIHPASGLKVLPDKEWHTHDFSEINLPFDAEHSFFDQMFKLERSVPLMATRNQKEPVNSISIVSAGDENDLITFWCKAKNSQFSMAMLDAEHSSDVLFGNSITDCYNVLHGDRLFNCKIIRYSDDCMNSSFLFDCRNCSDCFGAVNQRNAKYVFMGEQLSQEEYERRFAEVDLSCRSKLQGYVNQFHELMKTAVWPESFNIQTENCLGEHLVRCSDCRYCYSCANGPRNLYWTHFGFNQSENCAFIDGITDSSDCTYCVAILSSQHIYFSHSIIESRNLEYCMHCRNCEDCFGCVGLNRKRFHIFNKEYSEEEYWKKVDELKCAMLDRGEYGKFFPPSHGPSQFLESTEAMMLGECNKETAEKLGANMFDPATGGAVGDIDVAASVKPEEVPDCIEAIDDSWTKKPIYDPEIGRRFAYFPQELQFYRDMHLAPPNQHFMARAKALFGEMNVARYAKKGCDKCGKEVFYALNPIYPNKKIYCQQCYLQYLETR